MIQKLNFMTQILYDMIAIQNDIITLNDMTPNSK